MSSFYLDLNSDVLGLSPGSSFWFRHKLVESSLLALRYNIYNDHLDHDDHEDDHSDHVDDHDHVHGHIS